MPRSISSKVAAAVTVAAAVLVAVAPQAMADPWGTGTTDTGATPDGGSHAYCTNELGADSLLPNINYVMTQALGAMTDATVVQHTLCDFLHPQTDVRWLEDDLTGASGFTICAAMNPDNNNCDRNDVTLDLASINVGSNDDDDQSQTACHELGHTVGLSHATTDCMMSGEPPSSATTWRTFDAHHRGHINAWF